MSETDLSFKCPFCKKMNVVESGSFAYVHTQVLQLLEACTSRPRLITREQLGGTASDLTFGMLPRSGK